MDEMVTIIVEGKQVQVPARTSTREIRRIARCDNSRVLAQNVEGHHRIVSGTLEVHEGDTFTAGRPFTKGKRGETF